MQGMGQRKLPGEPHPAPATYLLVLDDGTPAVRCARIREEDTDGAGEHYGFNIPFTFAYGFLHLRCQTMLFGHGACTLSLQHMSLGDPCCGVHDGSVRSTEHACDEA